MKKRSSPLLVLLLVILCAAALGIFYRLLPQSRQAAPAGEVAEVSSACTTDTAADIRALQARDIAPASDPAAKRLLDAKRDKDIKPEGGRRSKGTGPTLPTLKRAHKPVKFIEDDQGVRLDPASLGDEVEYDITIKGLVLDFQDAPVAGASVFGDITINGFNAEGGVCYGESHQMEDSATGGDRADYPARVAVAISDGEGKFSCHFIRKVHEVLEVELSLWAESRGRARSVKLTLALDRAQREVEACLKLRLAASLSGRVVDDQGQPVAGAKVFVADHVDGLLHERDLEDRLRRDYQDDYSRSKKRDRVQDNVHTNDKNVQGVVDALRAEPAISWGPEDVEISLYAPRYAATEVFSGMTDAGGNFLIEDIAVGDYEVGASAAKRRFNGSVPNVKLVEGANALPEPMVLLSKLALRVTLKKADGTPVSENVVVQFIGGAGSRPEKTFAPDAGGAIIISQAPLDASALRVTCSLGSEVVQVNVGASEDSGYMDYESEIFDLPDVTFGSDPDGVADKQKPAEKK